ncbi:MAG: ATP-binding protein, partial [Pseudomonadota bacterium]|nr:ATP-binding protein [Pseudomonadota bacterium]
KNPLTPIQLSAERLKKKYLSQITEDPETFAKCTDTIIHHVGDIGRMVNEFSAFARMPEPVMKRENVTRHLQDMIILQKQAHQDITFNMVCENDYCETVYALADAQQIRQALTNIIQNAIDSIHGRIAKEKKDGVVGDAGQIDLLMIHRDDEGIAICVSDNGLGLPKDEDVSRLTEPYVTHREKGTGLGLAIVKKIMEDHEGRLVLTIPEWLKDNKTWRDLGGATVILTLPEENIEGETVSNNEAA